MTNFYFQGLNRSHAAHTMSRFPSHRTNFFTPRAAHTAPLPTMQHPASTNLSHQPPCICLSRTHPSAKPSANKVQDTSFPSRRTHPSKISLAPPTPDPDPGYCPTTTGNPGRHRSVNHVSALNRPRYDRSTFATWQPLHGKRHHRESPA
ncbi:hypothetical protein M3J09_004259 [Ascochyta lentis]